MFAAYLRGFETPVAQGTVGGERLFAAYLRGFETNNSVS